MQTSDFHFDLPPTLIAQRPKRERSASRLLSLDGVTGAITDRTFRQLGELLRPGDLLVVNDTRVIPARLFGRKASGGRVEMLIERVLDGHRALALIRASKSPRLGARLILDGDVEVSVVGRLGELFELAFPETEPVIVLLGRIGHVPLPPYIERPDDKGDLERYQTVFGTTPGAVAAPTAGLHFDRPLLAHLAERGVLQARVTLHVGSGTFQPLRNARVESHQMHAERVVVPPETVALATQVKAQGGRIVAVGTTAVRSLETAAVKGHLEPFDGETRLFIYPGYDFRVVDALVTNFHLPESSLIILVAAFAGYENVMGAYRHAVAAGYRFFSYGDAMFVTRNPDCDLPRTLPCPNKSTH